MKKTNKTFKRFAAITSASLLAACAMAPVFTSMTSYAAENGFTMSVPSGIEATEIKNIKAYKIFKCELVNDAFNVVDWATGVTPESLGFAAGTSAADAAKAINVDGYDKDALAKKAATALTTGGIEADSYTDGVVTFKENLTIGYYLVVCDVERDDKDASADTTTYDAKSLGMLTVTGRESDTEIGLGTAKVGLPKVEKKVQEDQEDNYKNIANATYETTDKSWNDVADYDIGDAVPFKLYGTMPDNLDKYSAYYYKFTDNLGTQFDKPTSLKVTIGNLVYTANYSGGNWTYSSTGGPLEKSPFTVAYNGDNGFTVEFKDIKPLIPKITGPDSLDTNTIVTVEYDAVLNTNAVVGNKGQNNEVYLTYSNNPNEEYNPSTDTTPDNTGDTPKDIVNVLTYAFELEKQFFNAAGGDITANEIAEGTYNNAEFALTSAGKELWFAPCEDVNYDYVVVKPDATGATQKLVLTEVDGELLIRIKGLDEGTYILSETKAPTGFNKAADQTILISATTANGQTWDGTSDTLSKFEYKIDTGELTENANATASALMKNNQGTSLPGTGGIGTTIFYLGGGAMAAIGGVYLISKRRMKKSEE